MPLEALALRCGHRGGTVPPTAPTCSPPPDTHRYKKHTYAAYQHQAPGRVHATMARTGSEGRYMNRRNSSARTSSTTPSANSVCRLTPRRGRSPPCGATFVRRRAHGAASIRRKDVGQPDASGATSMRTDTSPSPAALAAFDSSAANGFRPAPGYRSRMLARVSGASLLRRVEASSSWPRLHTPDGDNSCQAMVPMT